MTPLTGAQAQGEKEWASTYTVADARLAHHGSSSVE